MIYLVQTDTTAGLLSKDYKELNIAKGRDINSPCILTTASFKDLRVPEKFKNSVRRARKSTFIYQNGRSVRVVKDCEHAKFLEINGNMYSTSANLHGKSFDEEWARGVADVVVDGKLKDGKASRVYKISRQRLKRVR